MSVVEQAKPDARGTAEATPIQYGAGCAFALGSSLLAWIPLEGAWGWLRTGVFTLSDGQDFRLLLGSGLVLTGLIVTVIASAPAASPRPMSWRAALLDAARSVPRRLVIWLILTRLLRGHFDLRSALLVSILMFGMETLHNRFPIAPWRRKSRDSVPDRVV